MIADLMPYPALKDSGVPWLGEVPEHWEVRRGKGLFFHRKQINASGRETNVLSLTLRGVVNNDPDNPEGLVPKDYATYQLFREGDLVFKLIDLENLRTSRVGLVHENGIMSSAYVRLTPKVELDIRFFYQQYFDLYQRGIYNQLGAGVRSTLGSYDLLEVRVLVPPLPEQAAIVRFLDHADRRIRRYIRAKQKLIKLLEEQKQAIIHRAVTRGLDPNVRLKPSGVEWLGDVPEHWEVLTLRRAITRAVDGPHHSPGYLDSGIPFLSARNIKTDRWSLEDAKFISEDDYTEFSRRVVPEFGDVLYTKGGTTGVARAVDLPFRFQVWVHIAVLKVKRQKVVPAYLALVLNSPRCYEQAQLFTRGATNQDLGLGRMKGIWFALPPISEQNTLLTALASKIKSLGKAADGARREVDLLREYRTRLIADVVTGKLDVREAAARLSDEVEELEPFDEIEAEGDADEASIDHADASPEEAEA